MRSPHARAASPAAHAEGPWRPGAMRVGQDPGIPLDTAPKISISLREHSANIRRNPRSKPRFTVIRYFVALYALIL